MLRAKGLWKSNQGHTFNPQTIVRLDNKDTDAQNRNDDINDFQLTFSLKSN